MKKKKELDCCLQSYYPTDLANLANLTERITIVNGDLYGADLSEATVITLYLTYWANKELKPKLERETRPGTRTVSHDFEVPGWRPMRKEKNCGDTIYLYHNTAK